MRDFYSSAKVWKLDAHQARGTFGTISTSCYTSNLDFGWHVGLRMAHTFEDIKATVCCALGKGAPSYKSNITWCAIIALYIMSNYHGLCLHKNVTRMVIKPNIVCYCVCYIDQSIFFIAKVKNNSLLKYIYVLHRVHSKLGL